MKINEIVVESFDQKYHGTPHKLSTQVSDTLPGVYVQQQLRNTDPYMQYRYGMAVASARAVANGEVEFSQETAFAENLTQVMYASEDEETIKMASKLMGVTPTKVADTKSHEDKQGIDNKSPVAKRKKNKYGV